MLGKQGPHNPSVILRYQTMTQCAIFHDLSVLTTLDSNIGAPN